MSISARASRICLAAVIIISIAVSTLFMVNKQGFHEDELLTYNLANSSDCLSVGGINDSESFNDYLCVSEDSRFDYARVYENQIKDASHPPLYYALVHTVCSFFPGVFSKYFAFSVNVAAMVGALVLLFCTALELCKNRLRALIVCAAYAFSIACVTTAIYLRMYSLLTFFCLAFIYLSLKIYKEGRACGALKFILLGAVVLLGTLTQYYFILMEALTAAFVLVFRIKDKLIKPLLKYIISIASGSAAALCVYPYIISNVLGGNRGFGSISMSLDPITVVTYFIYKAGTYVQILAKDMFLNCIPLLIVFTLSAAALWIYLRFFKKKKTPRELVLALMPSVLFFAVVAMASPFNSDRYIMASLPMLSAAYVLACARILGMINKKPVNITSLCCLAAYCAGGFVLVKPYYTYGVKTELYSPQTENCLFVGTAAAEWNKNIDKLENYDKTLIVQTSAFSPTLPDELDSFAQSRGVVTNGKIGEFIDGYMNNGGEKSTEDSLESSASELAGLVGSSGITVYVSRLADNDAVIDYVKKNTGLENYELISEDCDFENYYNWYDYFAETESYCNVYRFY